MKSFAAQGISQVINIIIQICSVPIFLHFWGKELYGEWLLLSTIPAYLSLADFGFGTAAGTDMTVRVARGDKDGALAVYQSAWLMITGISVTITLIFSALAQFLPLMSWFGITHMTHPHVVTIVILLTLQVFVAQQMQLLGAGFRCDGNYARGVNAMNIQRFAEFLVGFTVVCFGGQPVIFAAVVLGVGVVFNTLARLDLYRRSRWLTLGWRHKDWSLMREMSGPALAFMGFPIGHALSLQGVLTVVGLVLKADSGAVVVFSTSRTLSRFVWQIVNTIANSVWVELSVAMGAGNFELARTLHRRACQVAFWLASLFGSLLFVLGGPIYHLWTKGKLTFDPILFGILILVVISNSLWATSYTVSMAVNRHQKVAMTYVIATACSLMVSFFFTHIFGLRGTAVSLLLIDMIMNVYVLRVSMEILNENWHDFFGAVRKFPGAAIYGKLSSKLKLST